MNKGSFFSTSLPTLVISCLLDYSHSNKCEEIPHCDFGLHFPVISDAEHLFMYFLAICISPLEKCSSKCSAHLKIRFVFFRNWVVWVPYIFWTLTPYQIDGLQIFSSIPWIDFSFCWVLLLLCGSYLFKILIFVQFSSLLLIYSYYKILTISPMLYSTSLNLSYS